eukprot:13118127-Heterocapsa_arctica.AAC.1
MCAARRPGQAGARAARACCRGGKRRAGAQPTPSVPTRPFPIDGGGTKRCTSSPQTPMRVC